MFLSAGKKEPRHEKTCLRGFSDQARHKPACSATEASESHEIANIETIDIILSRQRTTKALIRLRGSQTDLRLFVRIWHKAGFLIMRLNCKCISSFDIVSLRLLAV